MNRVTVKIANQEYTIIGDEKKEYLLQLASYVDEEMERMIKASPRMSHSMAAVLTAINVSDALFKERNAIREPNEQVKNVQKSTESLQEELKKRDLEVQELLEKISATESNQVSDQQKDQYESKIAELERKLMESEMITIDFQNRLYDLQLELETKKSDK